MGLHSGKGKGQVKVKAITLVQQMSPNLSGDDGNESKECVTLPLGKIFYVRGTFPCSTMIALAFRYFKSPSLPQTYLH